MNPEIIATIVNQIFSVAAAALASGAVTTLITQLLKWKAIKAPASYAPVPVAAVLSFIVSAAVVYGLNVVPLVNGVNYIIFSLATLLVSTQSYDIVKRALTDDKTIK